MVKMNFLDMIVTVSTDGTLLNWTTEWLAYWPTDSAEIIGPFFT